MHRGVIWVLAAFVITFMALLHSSHAIPFYPNGYTNSRHKDYLVEVEDPDAVLDMLAKLGQSILRAQHEGSNTKSVTVTFSERERLPDVYKTSAIDVINLPEATTADGKSAKRGLDLGLARGFSGSQAAKHLMGLAAANFAAGPGKKKRGSDMSSSSGRGDLTFGLSPAAAQDYLPVSPASSNEWALGNKE